MQQSGETGGKLAEMIKKAIKDGKLTNAEYDQIMMLADADQVIDAQEKRLLNQLQELLANKSVVRVAEE
jgi:NADH dehydrogenase FAD-containing subunit